MKIIICGKIGAGKTTATGFLRSITNIPSIDADDIAKNLYKKNGDLRQKIESIFRCEIFSKGEVIDKASFRKELVKNPDKIKEIDSLVHPRVEKILLEYFEKNEKIFIETPVFLSHLFGAAEKVLEIKASKEIRKKRSGFEDDFFEIMNERQRNNFPSKEEIVNEDSKDLLKKKILGFTAGMDF